MVYVRHALTPQRVCGPLGHWDPQTYTAIKYFMGSFGLDFVLLTGGILDSCCEIQEVIEGPDYQVARRGGGRGGRSVIYAVVQKGSSRNSVMNRRNLVTPHTIFRYDAF